MSVTIYQRQTVWEETEEEYRKRCELARSSNSGWIGTIIGLMIAIPALISLILYS